MNPFIAIGQQDPFASAMSGPSFQPQGSSAPPSYDDLMERQAKLKRLGLDNGFLEDIGNQSINNARKRQQIQEDVQSWIGKQGKAGASAL